MPSDLTSPVPPATIPASATVASKPGWPPESKTFAFCAIAVGLCFIVPLYKLVRFAAASSLYSHILLIPFISVYLLRIVSGSAALPGQTPRRARGFAIFSFLVGVGLLIGYRLAIHSGWTPAAADYLALHAAAALAFFYAGCFMLVDIVALRRYAFPLAFLVFAIPFPDRVYRACETFLQYRSADAAYLFFNFTGMPVWRDGTEFRLPGFSLGVAPECSGIHSSLVLVISSFLAAWLLLRHNWSRAILIASIIPLGIWRNGFRIWVLGELCVHDSHDWIHSPLHHQGGPIFFVLSLIPLFALLFVLRKLENRKTRLTAP